MGLNFFWNDRISSIEAESVYPGFTLSTPINMILPSPLKFSNLLGFSGDTNTPTVVRGKLRPKRNGDASIVNGAMIAFKRIGFNGAIAVRIRLYSDEAWTTLLKDTGEYIISGVFGPNPDLSERLFFAAADFDSYGVPGYAAKSYRIDFNPGPSGDFNIARVMIGNFLTLADQPKYGTEAQIEESTQIVETVSGRLRTVRRKDGQRVWSYRIEAPESTFFGSDAEPLRTMMNFLMDSGRSREVAVFSADLNPWTSFLGQSAAESGRAGGWGHIDAETSISPIDRVEEGVYYGLDLKVRELL